MTNPLLNRRNLLAMACALAVTGCVTVDYGPPPGGGGGGGGGGGIEEPPPPPAPDPSDIALSPGYFKGRDSTGDRIRTQVKRDGRDYRVQSLKGKNGPERLYRDQGGNLYVAGNGYSIRVSSARSFYWEGPHGSLVMND